MTWAEFNSSVRSLLTVDADRLNVQTFINLMIRQAAIDLQEFIKGFRVGQETIYRHDDFVAEGSASRGTLPPEAQIQSGSISIIEDEVACTCKRYDLTPYPYESRFDLINNAVCLSGGSGYISIDPWARSFYVFPVMADGSFISVFWDGVKIDFAGAERVPFTEGAVMAAAEFVKAKLSREINRDLSLHDSYMASYESKRTLLYLDAKDRQLVHDA